VGSPNIGDVLELSIVKIVPRGYGLAFADGLTVFVSLSAPGDRVRATVTRITGKTAFADTVAVLEPSPVRTLPPCPYFSVCGGCDFQQLDYAAQLEAKREIVRESLERIGKLELREDVTIIGSPDPLNYRLRAQWHADPQSGAIGYFRRGSREVIDIEKCPKLAPALNDELALLRRDRGYMGLGERPLHIDAACGDDGQVSVAAEFAEAPAVINYTAYGERYRFNAKSFFQGNRYLVDALIEAAVGGESGEHAIDLYCGVGLFTLPLARRFASVAGVEENPAAIAFARENAELAGLDNVRFSRQAVRDWLARTRRGAADLVLLDPPRAGTERAVTESILKMRPKRISYVSCEPSILARDLRKYTTAGYEIRSITALDLFPQTHHVETVARLDAA
jgi:23S rRNA (uracil1939-C5)-methyltransferase